jgi:hypothetical protein
MLSVRERPLGEILLKCEFIYSYVFLDKPSWQAVYLFLSVFRRDGNR